MVPLSPICRHGPPKHPTTLLPHPTAGLQVDSTVSELQRLMDVGHVRLPDTVFIYNPRDVPVCGQGED